MLELRARPASAREQVVLDQEPERDLQTMVCIDAWQTLHSARPHILRLVPVPKAAPLLMPFRGEIPWPAIEQYGRFHCLSREAVVLLAEVIAGLDAKRTQDEVAQIRRSAR